MDKFHGKLGELMWTMPFTKPWSAAVSRPLAPFRSCRPSRRAKNRWSRSGSGERLEANGRQSGFWEMDDEDFFLLKVSKGVKIGKHMCVYLYCVFFLYGKNYDCATAVCWLLFYMYVFMLCPWVLGPQLPKPPNRHGRSGAWQPTTMQLWIYANSEDRIRLLGGGFIFAWEDSHFA